MHKSHVTFVELEAEKRSILKQSNVEFLRHKIWYIFRIMVIWSYGWSSPLCLYKLYLAINCRTQLICGG